MSDNNKIEQRKNDQGQELITETDSLGNISETLRGFGKALYGRDIIGGDTITSKYPGKSININISGTDDALKVDSVINALKQLIPSFSGTVGDFYKCGGKMKKKLKPKKACGGMMKKKACGGTMKKK